MSEVQGVLSRVRTYSISLWRYQSCKMLDPYVLASFGFAVVAFMTLQCDTCHHRVVISEDQDSSFQRKLQGHEECPGMKRGILNFTDQILYSEMDRILQTINFLSVKPVREYPLINSKSMSSFVGVNGFLFKKVLALYEMNPRYFKTAFILQLFGWYVRTDQRGQQCIACHFCGRTMKLQQFARNNGEVQDMELEASTPEAKLFDLVQGHRYFCMWVKKDGGWLVLLQYLEDRFHETNYFKFKTTPLETKRTRVQIGVFIDSFQNKLESTVSRLMHVTHQVGNLCEKMGKDHNLSISVHQNESDVKKLRNRQGELQSLRDNIHSYYLENSLSSDRNI